MAYRNEKKTGAYRRVPIAPGQAAYCRPLAGNSGEASGVSAMGGEPAPHQESRHGGSASDFGEFFDALLNVLIGGDVVGHDAVVVLAVGDHVEVARAGEAEDDGLLLAGLPALDGLVDGHPDGVAGLGGGKDALHPGEHLGCLKDLGLLHRGGFHVAVVIQLAQDRAHAVIPQAAGVVGRGDEAAAQGVHLGQRTYLSGITEIICILSTGQARAACRFYSYELVIFFSSQFFTHKWSDQSA